MKILFYAQRESDLHCIGPGNGTVDIMAHNSTITVKVHYQYDSLPDLQDRFIECGFSSFCKFQMKGAYEIIV